jgi:hypothetical protein
MKVSHVAMPRHRRGMKLAYHFDEDEVTLAWDTVAGLPAGTRLRVEGLDLPAWWWAGTKLEKSGDADWVLAPVPTTLGPSVVLYKGALPDVEAEARRLHGQAPALPEAIWQQVRLARDGPDTEADFPLGAYVAATRHDEVTAQRMQWPQSTVKSWTSIGAGAAPTEFQRLQAAVGAYHVVLVEAAGKRTVGIWTEAEAPSVGQRVRPVLRRLFRTQGAWRYGVKFAPATLG